MKWIVTMIKVVLWTAVYGGMLVLLYLVTGN